MFHRNITILTFWNIFENKYIFNSFRNIVERFGWNVSILNILLIFQNVANDESFKKILYVTKISFLKFYLTPKNVTVIFK